MRPGKNKDGYFLNDDIIAQAEEAMEILQETYPEYDHVFVYVVVHNPCVCDKCVTSMSPL